MKEEFKFKYGNIFYCSVDWNWKVTNMQDYDIWLVCEGKGKVESKNRTYNITDGDCFIFPPGSSHYATHDPEYPLKIIAIHFDIVSGGDEFQYHRKLKKLDFVSELLCRSIDSTESYKADFWLSAALQVILDVDIESSIIPESYYAPLINDICWQIERTPQKNTILSRWHQKAAFAAIISLEYSKSSKGCLPKTIF